MLRHIILLILPVLALAFAVSPASASMTAREFVGLEWAKDKLAIMQPYVEHFEDLGYQQVPDAYALTARMELNIHTHGSYATWLDILALTAARDLGMHK